MNDLRKFFKEDPTVLDRLLELMSFVKEDEKRLGRRWTPLDWKCLDAACHANTPLKEKSTKGGAA